MRGEKVRRTAWAAALVTIVVASALIFPASARPGRPDRARPALQKLDIDDRRAPWAEGRLLVQFRPAIARAGAAARGRALQLPGARVARRITGLGIDVVTLPSGASVSASLRALSGNPSVAHAEPDRLVFPSQTPPDDTDFAEQWSLDNTGQPHEIADPPPVTAAGSPDADIDAPEAWIDELGDPEAVIAILDSGVDVAHPDLDASIWVNPLEIDNGLDDDGNGYVDDVNGWDFGDDDDTLVDTRLNSKGRRYAGYGHGTHVAGTAAAETNNADGIAGVCPQCKLMVLKFMKPIDTNGNGVKDTMAGSLSDELEGISYAESMGADVLNGSFGSYQYSGFERSAFKALERSGVLSVLAAGNESLDNDMSLGADFNGDGFADVFSPAYPASYTVAGILSVAASNHTDEYGSFTGCATRNVRWQCAFTNWGHDSVDVSAPGVDILSTTPTVGATYEVFNGTSMAAAHAAGLAGLIESQQGLDAVALKNVIMNSVDRPGGLAALRAFPRGVVPGAFTRTSGRINADNAVVTLPETPDVSNATPSTDGNIGSAKLFRKRKSGAVRWPNDINDVYKKRLVAGVRYKVVLNGPRTKDFDLLVWKPGTKEIWQIEPGCGGGGECKLVRYIASTSADESGTFTAKQNGVYYLQVSAWLFNQGDYTLKIRKV